MLKPSEVQREARGEVIAGAALIFVGVAILSATDFEVPLLPIVALVSSGQFFLLRGLVTWAVSRGTAPLHESLHELISHGSLRRAQDDVPSIPSPPAAPAADFAVPLLADVKDQIVSPGGRYCADRSCERYGIGTDNFSCTTCEEWTRARSVN